MTGVRLRSATVADLPAITRIWRQGWADGHARSWRGRGVAQRLLCHAEASSPSEVGAPPGWRYEREVGEG